MHSWDFNTCSRFVLPKIIPISLQLRFVYRAFDPRRAGWGNMPERGLELLQTRPKEGLPTVTELGAGAMAQILRLRLPAVIGIRKTAFKYSCFGAT